MKRFATAVLLLVGCLAVPATARADVISVQVLVPPFPATLAYPGFPSYTQVDFTAPEVIDFVRVAEAANGFLSTGAVLYGSGGLISNFSTAGLRLATGDNHVINDSANGFTDNALHVFGDGGGSTGNMAFAVGSTGATMQIDVFLTVSGSPVATVILDDSNGSTITQSLSEGPAVLRILFNNPFTFTFEGTNLSGVNQIGLTGADITAAAAVPEPTSILLFGSGVLALRMRRRYLGRARA